MIRLTVNRELKLDPAKLIAGGITAKPVQRENGIALRTLPDVWLRSTFKESLGREACHSVGYGISISIVTNTGFVVCSCWCAIARKNRGNYQIQRQYLRLCRPEFILKVAIIFRCECAI